MRMQQRKKWPFGNRKQYGLRARTNMKNLAIWKVLGVGSFVVLSILFVRLMSIPDFLSKNKHESRPIFTINTFRIIEQDCVETMEIKLSSFADSKTIVFNNKVNILVDYVNESRDVMSLSVWDDAFSEAEYGRTKLDPMIFPKHSDVYRYSDQRILAIFWMERNKHSTKGRVWGLENDNSYSFELIEPVSLKPTEVICCIKNLNFDFVLTNLLEKPYQE
jgi:hypothetical protein